MSNKVKNIKGRLREFEKRELRGICGTLEG
jgi:hypothetical protein